MGGKLEQLLPDMLSVPLLALQADDIEELLVKLFGKQPIGLMDTGKGSILLLAVSQQFFDAEFLVIRKVVPGMVRQGLTQLLVLVFGIGEFSSFVCSFLNSLIRVMTSGSS